MCCEWWGRHKRQHQLTRLISCFMCWKQSFLGVRRRWIDSFRNVRYCNERHTNRHFQWIHRVCMWRVLINWRSVFYLLKFKLQIDRSEISVWFYTHKVILIWSDTDDGYSFVVTHKTTTFDYKVTWNNIAISREISSLFIINSMWYYLKIICSANEFAYCLSIQRKFNGIYNIESISTNKANR